MLQTVYNTFLVIVRAYPMTLILSVLPFFLALILGFIVAWLKMAKWRPLRIVGTLYVNFFRNLPYIILIFIIYYGVPVWFEIDIDKYTVAVLSLSLNQAAYFGEIIRGGLSKIQTGQIEAGEAIGLSRWQSLRFIVIPQVMYAVTPALMGQATQLIKSTSVISVIGITELAMVGRATTISTHAPFVCFTWVAIMYFVVCYMLQWLARKIERKNLRIMRGT